MLLNILRGGLSYLRQRKYNSRKPVSYPKIKIINCRSKYFTGTDYRYIVPYEAGMVVSFLRKNNVEVTLQYLAEGISKHNKRLLFYPKKQVNLNILGSEEKILNYINTDFYDKKVDSLAAKLLNIISYQDYDLIGFSITVYYEVLLSLFIAKTIKSLKNIKIVFSGPFMAVYSKDYFARYPFIDYIIAGDAQVSFLELVRHLEGKILAKNVPNLLYREEGAVKINSREDLHIENFSIPDYSGLSLDFYRFKTYNMSIPLVYRASRGCKNNCAFCMRKAWNPHLEFKSYEKVINELKEMKERYNSNYFYFQDEAINQSYGYLKGLCDAIIENNLNIKWFSGVIADELDTPLIRKMKKAGCMEVGIGLESASPRMTKSMRKPFSPDKILDAVRNIHKEGISTYIYLMFGYPYESYEDIEQSIKFMKENASFISTVWLTRFYLSKYSFIYNNPQEFGITNIRKHVSEDNFLSLEFDYYAFDESRGLKWEDKLKQTEIFKRKLFRTKYKYILSKKRIFRLMPFWLYYWARDNIYALHESWAYRLLESCRPFNKGMVS